jgi:hypothetical protein
MDCPNCSYRNPENWLACRMCGAPLVPPTGDASPPSGQPPAHPLSGTVTQPAPVAGLSSATSVVLVLTGLSYLAVALVRGAAGGSPARPGIAAILSVLTLVPLLALIPLFLTWFFRIRRNAGLWGPQRRAQGWTIGAWFTPVVWLWFPYQIAADAWQASQPLSGTGRRSSAPVTAWWTCWLLAWITGYRVTHTTATGTDGSTRTTTFVTFNLGGTLPSALLTAAAAFLGAAVVRSLGRMQQDRMAEIAVPAPGWPQP